MPAPLVVAAAVHRNRKPLAGVVAVGVGMLLVLPIMLTGAPPEEDSTDPCTGDTVVTAGGSFRLPVVGRAVVTSDYGMRTNPGGIYKGRFMLHDGIDIAEQPTPTTVVSASSGRVKSVMTDNIGTNIVFVDAGNGVQLGYFHLNSFAKGLKAGDTVRPGTPLGVEGATGNVSGPHLHFQVHVNGKPTDPRPWMKKHGVTLPAVGGSVAGPAAGSGGGKATAQNVNATAQNVNATAQNVNATAQNVTATGGGSSFELPKPGTPHAEFDSNPPTSIPTDIRGYYTAAAKRFGLPWTLLAGIGMAETGHGRIDATSVAGAQGLMQFMPATFKSFGIDGDGDGQADITNDADSIYSAANYLVKSGVKNGVQGVYKALGAYNHSLEYRNSVLAYANAYGGGSLTASQCDAPASSNYSTKAVAKAKEWLGQPWVYNGGDWKGPTFGFDSSGLMMAVVATSTDPQLKLDHSTRAMQSDARLSTVTTWSQGGTMPDATTLGKLQPGDLVIFNGGDGPWGQGGIYIGDGKLIQSQRGQVVKTAKLSDLSWAWMARRPLAKYTGTNPTAAPGDADAG